MFQMCGVFAEFERAMIVERVNSGLARAKAKRHPQAASRQWEAGERSADEQRSGNEQGRVGKAHPAPP